jgi:hypothetical protein
MTEEQKSTGLVVRSELMRELQKFGQWLSEMTDAQLPEVLDFVTRLEKNIEGTRSILKERALLYLNVHGIAEGEKGTKAAQVGQYTVKAIPTRTGLDPKKLEKALRTKGIDPNVAMKPTVSYAVDPDKVAAMRVAGTLTEQDIEACQYDRSYRIDVKRGEDEEQ